MKHWMGEFKAFLLRGNVVDLAVGVVIGVAFSAVVTSLVEDVLTPLIGVFGMPDFSNLIVNVGQAELRYGQFLNAAITFVVVSFSVFFFAVKPINALIARTKRGVDPEAPTRPCPRCLSQIPKAADRCAYCAADIPAAV